MLKEDDIKINSTVPRFIPSLSGYKLICDRDLLSTVPDRCAFDPRTCAILQELKKYRLEQIADKEQLVREHRFSFARKEFFRPDDCSSFLALQNRSRIILNEMSPDPTVSAERKEANADIEDIARNLSYFQNWLGAVIEFNRDNALQFRQAAREQEKLLLSFMYGRLEEYPALFLGLQVGREIVLGPATVAEVEDEAVEEKARVRKIPDGQIFETWGNRQFYYLVSEGGKPSVPKVSADFLKLARDGMAIIVDQFKYRSQGKTRPHIDLESKREEWPQEFSKLPPPIILVQLVGDIIVYYGIELISKSYYFIYEIFSTCVTAKRAREDYDQAVRTFVDGVDFTEATFWQRMIRLGALPFALLEMTRDGWKSGIQLDRDHRAVPVEDKDLIPKVLEKTPSKNKSTATKTGPNSQRGQGKRGSKDTMMGYTVRKQIEHSQDEAKAVYQVERSGQLYALKVISGRVPHRELRALTRLAAASTELAPKERHTVPLVDVVYDDGNVGLVFPWLQSFGRPGSLHECVTRIGQLMEAVMQMHRAEVAHCDLKPANVLMDPQTKQLVVIDFDCAMPSADASTVVCSPWGTDGWSPLADEKLEEDGYQLCEAAFAVDAFGCGAVALDYLSKFFKNSIEMAGSFNWQDTADFVQCEVGKALPWLIPLARYGVQCDFLVDAVDSWYQKRSMLLFYLI